jgi:sterol desaturase/sphingolipid hydroxylase (fatty acid hydroxylase superfamily)
MWLVFLVDRRALLIVLVALPLQLAWPAVVRRPKFLFAEYYVDIAFALQNLWLSAFSLLALFDALELLVYGPRQPWLRGLAALPLAIQVALAIWAFDFVVYWRHRLEHVIPALWSFHAVHHTAERVDVLTTTRLHPFAIALGLLLNGVVLRMGFSASALTSGFAIYLFYSYFIHANLRLRFDGAMKYVLVTPFMHQWHHAADLQARDKNFGAVFAWNDWLFGTAYHPPHWPTTFGLGGPPDEAVGQSYPRLLLYPAQYLWAKLKARRAERAAFG